MHGGHRAGDQDAEIKGNQREPGGGLGKTRDHVIRRLDALLERCLRVAVQALPTILPDSGPKSGLARSRIREVFARR
jgi:hypothetical protein